MSLFGISIWDIDNVVNQTEQAITRVVVDSINSIRNTVYWAKDAVNGWITFAMNTVISNITSIKNQIINAINYAVTVLSNSINSIARTLANFGNDIVRNIQGVVSNAFNTVTSGFNMLRTGLSIVIETTKNYLGDLIIRTVTGIIERVNNVATSVYNYIIQARDFIGGAIRTSQGIITDFIERNIRGIETKLSGAIASLYDKVSSFISGIRDKIIDKVEYVKNWLGSKVEEIRNRLEGVYNDIKKGVTDVYDFLKRHISEAITGIGDAVKTVIKELREQLEKFSEKIRLWIKEQIDSVRDYIEDKAENIRKWIDDMLEDISIKLSLWYETANKELTKVIGQQSKVFNKLINGEYTDYDKFLTELQETGASSDLIAIVVNTLLGSAVMFGSIFAASQPFLQNIHKLGMEKARPELLTPEVIFRSYFKGDMDTLEVMKKMGENGFTVEDINFYESANRPNTPEGQAQLAFLRGAISENEHDRLLSQYGYNENQIALFKQLYLIIPPIQDIIHMAVREAFSPDIAERFGQYENFPTEFGEWANKQGLSTEWAERYWAAHWGLPSPNQGFEMFQRRIIDEDTLQILLRALDVMPFWRDKMTQLSYNPLTRVDVRRMHKLGVISETEVYENYLDGGYSPENARRMTEFTIKYNEGEFNQEDEKIRELTQSIILQSYERQILSRDETLERLTNIGYSPNDANILISIRDYNIEIKLHPDRSKELLEDSERMILKGYTRRSLPYTEAVGMLNVIGWQENEAKAKLNIIDSEFALEVKNNVIETLRKLYVERTFSKTQVVDILSKFDFAAYEITTFFEQMDIMRDLRDRKPTQGQLLRWLQVGFLTLNDYLEELRGMGFAEQYITYFSLEAEALISGE